MSKRKITKLLVANRGEIAVRVCQTCRELGIATVTVFSDADADAVHRYASDESIALGGNTPAESYLDVAKLLAAVADSGADAVHPGYGFLSENADFSAAVEAAGALFVGPTAEHINAMGDKVEARRRMIAAGVPVTPGSDGPVTDGKELTAAANEIGFPLLVKAAGGGGGKGIRRVNNAGELEAAWQRAVSEAGSAFGDARVYLERLVEPARHIEAQVLGDGHGGALFLGERECSLQRKHQKLVEETPSPVIDEAQRAELREAAIAGVTALKYRGAGTMEFLYDENRREFYFLEMNTRLQVEHPVTEMVTGLDLVHEQLLIAEGTRFGDRTEPELNGHSIEFRVYAEDPYRGFVPSTGKIQALRLPHSPFGRIDAALRDGMEVSPFYDPMLGKVIVWGPTRDAAIRRLRAMLSRTRIGGIHTTVPLGIEICNWDDFVQGTFHTQSLEAYLDREHLPIAPPPLPVQLAAVVARAFTAKAGAAEAASLATPPTAGNPWQQAARLEGSKRVTR
ncbi:MAG: biotin carboxylase N-terminal domain-containing protein [Planctomycetota bacterium]